MGILPEVLGHDVSLYAETKASQSIRFLTVCEDAVSLLDTMSAIADEDSPRKPGNGLVL